MQGLFGGIISASGFGAANIVIKKSLASLTIPQTLMMSTLSGIFFLILVTLLAKVTESFTLGFFLAAGGLAILEVSLYLLLYKTYEVSNVTVATALISTYPIVATLFTVIFLNETLEGIKYIFILLMVIGVIVISINWDEVFKNKFDKKDLMKGLPWMFATMLIHTLYFPLLGEFTEQGSWEIKLLFIKIFSAIILFMVFFLVQRKKILPPKNKILSTSLLGLLEVIGWSGFSWASNSTEGQKAIIITALNSGAMVTAILAYIILQEKLSKLQYLGILIIVIGLTGLSL